jgi:hypothetical protein
MSKQPIDSPPPEADDLPPPYSPSSSAALPPRQPSSASPSLFTSQLSNLRQQVSANTSARQARDSQILSHLVPYIEDFISSIATFDPTPTRAEAILLPSGAVGHDWQLSDEHETRDGEIREVILVQRHDKLRSDAAGSSKAAYPSSSSASDTDLWWSDETMARRLSKHLQPEKPAAERAAPQPAPPPKQEKKPSRWKIFSKESYIEARAPSASAPNREPTEDVTMTAKAEEVTFRHENNFGIWESTTGWGIIVQIKLHRI